MRPKRLPDLGLASSVFWGIIRLFSIHVARRNLNHKLYCSEGSKLDSKHSFSFMLTLLPSNEHSEMKQRNT